MKKMEGMLDEYSLIKTKSSIYHKVKITSSIIMEKFGRSLWEGVDVHESFYLVMLNRANNVKGFVQIGKGGIEGVAVDIKIVVKYVVDSLASSVILMHNHPSGNLNPSVTDKQLTKNVQAILKHFDITVLDHIILGPKEGEYYSFANSNDLN